MQALKKIIYIFMWQMCFAFGAAHAQQSTPPLTSSKLLAADDAAHDWALYFGGPDKPIYHLRDVLGEWIDLQPEGGTIHLVLYYFRDPILAQKLVQAYERGVNINIVIEARPRKKGANDEIISYLQAAGLSQNITLRDSLKSPSKGRLHSKIYAFSHPKPSVMIGSFNPSGNNRSDDLLIEKIGNQDQGHNLLLQTYDEVLVKRLVKYVEELRRQERFKSDDIRRDIDGNDIGPNQIGAYSSDDALFIFPRHSNDIGVHEIANATKDAEIMGAISHMKRHPMIKALKKAAQRGANVTLVVHETQRRVPQYVVNDLRRAGVNIRRYKKGEGFPMHAKFLLLHDQGRKTTWLGSYNWNISSWKKNSEILLESRDAALFDALSARFDFIKSEVDGLAAKGH